MPNCRTMPKSSHAQRRQGLAECFPARLRARGGSGGAGDRGRNHPRPRGLYRDRCRRCIRLERDLFSTQAWADFAEGRVKIERIDMGGMDECEPAVRHNVTAKGSFVLVSAAGGRATARFEACEEPEEVIPWIKGVLVSP